MVSQIDFGIVGALQQVIHGYAEIVSNGDQLRNSRFPVAGFVLADGVLRHIQLNTKKHLRKMLLFSQFL